MPFLSRLCAPFLRPPDAAPTPAQVERNLRHLVWDTAWFGVLWGTLVAFLQVYVVRLGASSLLVGAITYGPALVGILWQIPAARLMTRSGRRMRWVIGSGFAYRLMFLLVAVTPFLFARGRAEMTALIWLLAAIPSNLSNTSFVSMMADAVPAGRMTQVVGWRMAAFGLANTLANLLGGRLLVALPFPLNYQVLFLIGYAASLVSWWHCLNLHVPDPPPAQGPRRPFWRDLGAIVRRPRFGRFLLGIAAMQLALGMIAPLLPLYWVRRLDAGDDQVSVILTVASAAMVVGSLVMRRVVAIVGREVALAAGTLGYALYPLLTSLTGTVGWLAPWAALAGLSSAAINVSLMDNLVSVTSEQDRTNYIGVYGVATNMALFAGPLLAGVLAAGEQADLALALRIAAGMGVAAAALLLSRRRT